MASFRAVAPVAAAAALFACLALFFASQICDDAFIYFRYARHLADGRGLSWNPGESPVEGFSSPLWVLLLAAGLAGGLDAVSWARFLGIALAAAVPAGTWLLARRLDASLAAAGIACLLVVLLRGLHYWAGAGMETSLWAACVVWTAVGLAGGRPMAWAIPAALLGVARPEGPVLVAVVVAAAALRDRRMPPLRAIVVAAAPALAWLAFRLREYGVPFPNTYYAKATGPQPGQLADGLRYAVLAIGALVPAGAAWLLHPEPRPRALLPVLALPAALLAAVAWSGGDWMWNHRLLVPAIPPLVAVAVSCARPRLRVRIALLAVLMPLAAYRVGWSDLRSAVAGDAMLPRDRQEGTMTDAAGLLADWIRPRFPPGTLVAVDHAGALPYRLDWPALDMAGLCDARLARVPGGLHRKFDTRYVLARRPGLIVLNSRVRPGTSGGWYHFGYWEGETALFLDPGFQADYVPLPVWAEWRWVGGRPSYIVPFARRDLVRPQNM